MASASASASASISAQHSLQSLPSLNIPEPSVPAVHRCISTLRGHSSSISALAIHGSSLYSASADNDIQIWTELEPESSDIQKSSHAAVTCKSPTKSLLISGDTIFSSHQDCKIRVWRINHKENHSSRLQAVLPTVKDQILGLLSPNKYVQVRRHKNCTWVQHADAVSALAVSNDRSLLYSVSWDRSIKIWRLSDFKCVESVPKAHKDAINAVVVTKEGFVYTGSADKTIKVWKRNQNQKKHTLVDTLERHKSAVNALALSCDETILYSGACDRSVVVWEGRDGQRGAMGALRGHTRAVLCLSVSRDLVCSGSADKTVRMWRRGEERGVYTCVGVLEGHGRPVKSLAMVAKAEDYEDECNITCLVYSGCLDSEIKVWKLLIPSSG